MLVPRLFSSDYRYPHLAVLVFGLMPLLISLPFYWFGYRSALLHLWVLLPLLLTIPGIIRPTRTVYASPAGFALKALFRRTVTYPAQAFTRVELVDSRRQLKAYLVFTDGKRYPAVFTHAVRKRYLFVFEDEDHTEDELNKFIRTALIAPPNEYSDHSSAAPHRRH